MNFLIDISNMNLDNLLQVSNEILGEGRREAKLGSFFISKTVLFSFKRLAVEV